MLLVYALALLTITTMIALTVATATTDGWRAALAALATTLATAAAFLAVGLTANTLGWL